jgi:hypothetical protein
MTLLQKDLKYNLHTKQENWIQDLALEAETAIQKLPASDRDTYRHLVAECPNTLKQNNTTHSKQSNAQQEAKTIKSIQSKLQNNDAIITRADKSNSIVILTNSYSILYSMFYNYKDFFPPVVLMAVADTLYVR